MARKEWLPDPQRWNRYAYVRNNPLIYIDPEGLDLVIYMFFNDDLTDEQKKYLDANLAEIKSKIAEKFEKAGVETVDFRMGSSLTYRQKSLIEKNGSREKGVGQLYFSNNKSSAYPEAKGARDNRNRSHIFLNTTGGDLDYSNKSDHDTLNFRMGEVGAHELGHGQKFESDKPTKNWIKGLFGLDNLMGEGAGTPTKPRWFDRKQDRTKKAIEEINKIGDNTPN